jgi:hypothetical protein
MKSNKEAAAIRERISKLESASRSLKEQVAKVSGGPDKATWEEAASSVDDELSVLRRELDDSLGGRHEGHQESFLEALRHRVHEAEHLVFSVFVLGSTIIGSTTLLGHEAKKAIDMIEEPTRQQETVKPPATDKTFAGSGAEPIPKSLMEKRERVFRMFNDPTFSSEPGASDPEPQNVQPQSSFSSGFNSLQHAVLIWSNPEKMGESNSITEFQKAVRQTPRGSSSSTGAKT